MDLAKGNHQTKSRVICSVKASHGLSSVSQVFDEPNLVSHGGLLTAGVLTERVGLWPLVASTLTVPGPTGVNGAAKVATVLAGMLAGADSIDDLDVLRSGAIPALFDDLRAPSTVGSWLRAFTHGNVRQLDAVTRELRARLWAAGAGPHRLDERLFLDGDSTIARAYGLFKQGVSFGYTRVRGYHPLIATVLEPGGTPDVLHTRLREGRANTARGAASFIAEAISRVRVAGSSGELVVRLDGGFYNAGVVAAWADARFSVTARNDSKIRAAIAAIEDTAWTAIPYWSSEVDEDTGEVVDSHADVAETTYTAFAGTRRAVTARLVVRRVRRLRPVTGQLELDTDIWRHHALLTDRCEPLLTVEAEHRGHAVIENRDRRPQAQRHGPSTLRIVHRQWCLAGAGRPRPQPDPGAGHPRRSRPAPRHHRHHPQDADRHPRQAGPLRPPPTPADAPELALAAGVELV